MSQLKKIKYFLEKTASNLVVFLIYLYQGFSLFFKPTCRFIPTCSEYAKEAFNNYGFNVGLKLTIKRLLSCRPFGKAGYDPVPEMTTKRDKNGY